MPPHALEQGHSNEPVSSQHENQWEDEKKQVKDDGINQLHLLIGPVLHALNIN